MPQVMVIPVVALCIACYTGQSFFNKLFSMRYQGPPAAATPAYATLFGVIVAAVTLCLSGLRFAPDRETVLLGAVNGVVLFLYNLGMIKAARSGPYAFQSIVMLFGSIVVCLVFSAVWWGDKMGAAQLVGIGVMLAAFVVLNSGGIDFSGVKKEYFFWVALLFFSNGFYGVLMDAQQRLYPGQRNEMIVITFLSTAMVSLAYLLITQRGQAPAAFRMSPAALGFAVGSSVCAAFAVFLLMLLLAYIPSYILFTICNGGLLVASALLCAVVLKEKMTRRTAAGIGLSVLSIVLLNI